MSQILVFGTSNTYGCWDAEGGWVARLRKYLDEQTIASELRYMSYSIVYNLGITGDTTTGILERLEQEIQPRLDPDEETVIIFHVGINDAQYINSEKRTLVPADIFIKNCKTLIEKARDYTKHIFCLGLSPVDDTLVDPIPWQQDRSYKSEYVSQYDTSLQTLCKEENIPFIDTLTILHQAGGTNLLADGVHPTSEGHKIIFEAVKRVLEEKRILS